MKVFRVIDVQTSKRKSCYLLMHLLINNVNNNNVYVLNN